MITPRGGTCKFIWELSTLFRLPVLHLLNTGWKNEVSLLDLPSWQAGATPGSNLQKQLMWDAGWCTPASPTKERRRREEYIHKVCSVTEAYKRREKRPGVNSGHRMFAPEESQWCQEYTNKDCHEEERGLKMERTRESQGGGGREPVRRGERWCIYVCTCARETDREMREREREHVMW